MKPSEFDAFYETRNDKGDSMLSPDSGRIVVGDARESQKRQDEASGRCVRCLTGGTRTDHEGNAVQTERFLFSSCPFSELLNCSRVRSALNGLRPSMRVSANNECNT